MLCFCYQFVKILKTPLIRRGNSFHVIVIMVVLSLSNHALLPHLNYRCVTFSRFVQRRGVHGPHEIHSSRRVPDGCIGGSMQEPKDALSLSLSFSMSIFQAASTNGLVPTDWSLKSIDSQVVAPVQTLVDPKVIFRKCRFTDWCCD